MDWEVYKLKESGGRTAPFVSIGRGTLDFSGSACALINDNGQYKYAQILKGKDRGKAVVAVKFLEEYMENSIPIKRKKQNGKVISGMTIRNKEAISTLFGKDGTNDGMVRHKVELIQENILRIVE